MDEYSSALPPETLAYYARAREATRLGEGHGLIEFARTCEILDRWLPHPPANVLDVGGGPGAYAVWLARRGYRIVLVDAVPLHVKQALDAAASAGQTWLVSTAGLNYRAHGGRGSLHEATNTRSGSEDGQARRTRPASCRLGPRCLHAPRERRLG